MFHWTPRVAAALVFPIWAAGAFAQTAPSTETTRPPTLVILGASASAGFSDQLMTPKTAADREHNQTLRLQRALTPLWAEDGVSIRDYSNVLMFQDPEAHGPRQVDRAVKVAADAVLAIDFMFWFGYSVRGGDQPRRLELQQQGLRQLARIQAPLLVGDYPKMTDIDPRMLHPRAVPDAATLQALNDGLRAWAKERTNVHVLSIGDLLADLRTNKRRIAVGERTFEFDSADMLQTDRLHVTKLGMAVMAHHVTEALGKLASATVVGLEAHSLADVVRRLELTELATTVGDVVEPARATVEVGAKRQ
jgi:hypothetical protein